MPPALDGEFGRATGSSLQTAGKRHAWFGTTTKSAGTDSRVFRTADGGRTWEVSYVPVFGGDEGGVRSLAFWDKRRGIAVGGQVGPDTGQAATTADGGRTWTAAGSPTGVRNGVVCLPGRRKSAVTVGPNGSDLTTDRGRTWRHFDDVYLLGADCARKAGCWAVGVGGVAARLKLDRRK
jgi:photosystem II stability/assembly factor-like uncharacterized protein